MKTSSDTIMPDRSHAIPPKGLTPQKCAWRWRVTPSISIRPIQPNDNAQIADVIRTVSAEYDLTADKGYSVADTTLDNLYDVYAPERCIYLVVELNKRIVGGCGVGPLNGYDDTCELQKMYFLPDIRGKGLANAISKLCMNFAKQNDYQKMYLETTYLLPEALRLYQYIGFRELTEHLGNTGHNACEIPMMLSLATV